MVIKILLQPGPALPVLCEEVLSLESKGAWMRRQRGGKAPSHGSAGGGAGVSAGLCSVLWKVNDVAHFKPVGPINSICQLSEWPRALSRALSGAPRPSKCLVREMASALWRAVFTIHSGPECAAVGDAGTLSAFHLQMWCSDLMHVKLMVVFMFYQQWGNCEQGERDRNYYYSRHVSQRLSGVDYYCTNTYPESAGSDRWPQSHWLNTGHHPEGSESRPLHSSQQHSVHRVAQVLEELKHKHV